MRQEYDRRPDRAPPIAGGRVVTTSGTGILWMVYSGLRLMQSLVLASSVTLVVL